MKVFDDDFNERFNLSLEFDFNEYDFLFFDKPICFYNLKDITSKISSFEQLTYYAEVFFYLNPDVDFKIFYGIFHTLGDREWKKTIRTYSKARILAMCQEVFEIRKQPYCSQWRRIIFNPEKKIRNDEKMSICGELFKKQLTYTVEDVEKAVLQLKLANTLINDSNIADILNCSQKTIQRNMTSAIRNDIKKSNAFIKRKVKIQKIIEYIDILSEGGNEVKIRELRNFIAVKDYSMIKEAFSIYKDSL